MTQPKLTWRRVEPGPYAWASRVASFEECWQAHTGDAPGWSLVVTRDYVFTAGKRFPRSEHAHDLVEAMVFAEEKMVEFLRSQYGQLLDIKVP